MDATALDILRRCQLFRNLPDESIELLAAGACLERLPRGRLVFRQGDPCRGFYCVGAGAVRVYKLAPSGKEHILHFAEPGMTFAEAAALGRFAYPAFAEAIEETLCVFVPIEHLQHILTTNHQVCQQLLEGMGLWMRRLIGLLEDIVLRDATGRVAGYLLHAAETAGETTFTLPVLKKDLASHLNLTSETLSRTLRRLVATGLIRMPDAHQVTIVRRDALLEVVEGILPDEFA